MIRAAGDNIVGSSSKGFASGGGYVSRHIFNIVLYKIQMLIMIIVTE